MPPLLNHNAYMIQSRNCPAIFSGGAGGGGGSALATLAASMTTGQWAQMSPAPSGLSLFTGQGGVSGLAIGFAIKMGRDPNAKKIYFIGSDHIAPTIFLGYTESTNIWAAEAGSVPWGGGTNGNTTPSHGYDHTVFDPVGNKLYHRPFGSRVLRRWDGGTTWGSLDYSGTLAYNAGSAGVAWFPELGAAGRIVVYQLENGINGALISIDPDGTITTHVSGASSTLAGTGDPHCFCMYSQPRGCVVFGGGNGSSKVWKMNAAGTVTALDDIPAGFTETTGPASPNSMPFTDPVSGNIVVIQSANNWRELNPNAGSGSQWSVKGGTASILSANTFDASAYGVVAATLPEYGVAVFMKNYSGSSPAEMWLWKP